MHYFRILGVLYKKEVRMFVKRMILAVATMLLVAASVSAQDDGGRKLTKKERKALQERMDSLANAEAQKAIDDTAFVIEADEVTFKRGYTAHVDAGTNFVGFCGDKAVVQVAFNVPWPGFNGLGGITLDGYISRYEKTTDKRGNVYIRASVNGSGLSAQLLVTLWNGGREASVSIQPNFRSARLTLTGVVVPAEESRVFKGRAI